MKNRRIRFAVRSVMLFIIALAVGFTVYQVVQGKRSIEKGDAAPAFSLENRKGEIINLSDYRGQGVLLNFWGSWCEPCKREMPYLNEANKRHLKGVNIIAVNIRETPLVVNSFFHRYNLDFPTVLDRKGVVTGRITLDRFPLHF